MRISDLHRRILAGKKEELLLDLFPNAAAAYSLRKLRTAYTGNCIEIRRSSDNTLQNIGFVNNVLDTASLLSFVGAGNGFVRTWYDQSGNGRNAISITNNQQPRIVNNGIIDLSLTKPVIVNNAVSSRLISAFSISQPITVFNAVINPTLVNDNSAFRVLFSAKASINDAGIETYCNTSLTQKTFLYSGAILGDTTIRTGNSITTSISNGLTSSLHYNSNLIASGNAGTNSIVDARFGVNWTLGSFFNTRYFETIIYPSNQSANRTAIESNINSFYNIY
jgi:hypothetical protein